MVSGKGKQTCNGSRKWGAYLSPLIEKLSFLLPITAYTRHRKLDRIEQIFLKSRSQPEGPQCLYENNLCPEKPVIHVGEVGQVCAIVILQKIAIAAVYQTEGVENASTC